MIVEKTLQSFKDIHEWKMSVGLSKSFMNVLIYDGRILYSLSKQDSSNLLINLDCLDFSYEYYNLFQEITFHLHLITFKKKLIKVNKDLLSHENDTQNPDDSVNSNQYWNYTNDKFTGYGGFELQRRCDEF